MSGENESLINSRNHEIKTYEMKIAECEGVLIPLGPCPLITCIRHHEPTKDVEMVEPGQYVVSTNFSPTKITKNLIPSKTNALISEFDRNDRELSEKSFKTVSRKNATKQHSVETKTEIETSNKFQHLMDAEDQINLSDHQKTFIPAINLKLTDDYTLTRQEISRNHPETTNKYDRRYIEISPNSLEDRKNNRVSQ
ncbi:hypothetical protein AVEN_232396-1 [Araneus ventricosus]|uniref:Uncharacterized protein n=1 Tax=Araneus ventricosus TaxID=182803 RepID=A0A4Y2CU03_ARAVE|nr:hypothetical protein AVEN_232396-1 [Araneus ventricosus]